jgi:hypothetical protein
LKTKGAILLFAFFSVAEHARAQAPARATECASGASYAFDSEVIERPPKGFSFARVGSGAAGHWSVRAEKDAPSKPNVLAQVDVDKSPDRVLIAIADQPQLKDLVVRVRCKMISGRVEQSCGLVFRYKDESNYMLIRANALEGNLRLYAVRDGKSQLIESFSGAVTGGVWHELSVTAKADQIEVDWDGARALKTKDKSSMPSGKAGVWTQADSVTYFDDLSVTTL